MLLVISCKFVSRHINFIISRDFLAYVILEKRRSAIDREISLVYKRCNTFDVLLNGSGIVFLHAHTFMYIHASSRQVCVCGLH